MFAVMRHGIRSWWKNGRSLMLGLFTPLLLFLVFASIYTGRRQGIPELPVAWVDQDHSPVSQRFLSLLESDGTIRPLTQVQIPFENDAVSITPENVKSLLRQGKISLAVILSPGFGEQVTRFQRLNDTFVQIYFDPTQSMQANMLKGLMTKAGFLLVSENWGQSGVSDGDSPLPEQSPMDPHMRHFASLLGQAFRESREFMRKRGDSSIQESFIPISMNQIETSGKQNIAAAQQLAGVAVIFLLFSVARAGAILLDEKQSGTLKRLLSSPLSMRQLVLGKILSLSANGFAQITFMCFAGWLLFQIPIFNSPLALMVMILVTAVSAASFGLFLATFCQTAEQVQASATFLILTMSLVGGSMIPKFLLPPWTQKLSAFTLNGWAMDGFMNVLVRGMGLNGVWLPSAVLLLMFAVFLTLSLALLPRRLYE